MRKIYCIWEHKGDDTILYAENYPGAFARGASKEEALQKMEGEVRAYLRWRGEDAEGDFSVEIVQEQESTLEIRDADSDVIFDAEKKALSEEEYLCLKELVLKSAADFYVLYASVPDQDKSCLSFRKTFYGTVPRTAREMYEHTKNVNAYYFGEIGICAPNDGTIYDCRKLGFELLEHTESYLDGGVICGSFGEDWSLRKVLRRFLWHDRIHAKAMYRMAVRTFGENAVKNVFGFGEGMV